MFNIANSKIAAFFKSLWGTRRDFGTLTPKQANQLQKEAFLTGSQPRQKVCTPPYMAVAVQMMSDKEQVFEAAVYYLCVIAGNQPRCKKPIVDILNRYISENKKYDRRVSFVKAEMDKYQL